MKRIVLLLLVVFSGLMVGCESTQQDESNQETVDKPIIENEPEDQEPEIEEEPETRSIVVAPVQVGDFWGLINPEGEFVVEAKYPREFHFENGYAYSFSFSDGLHNKISLETLDVEIINFDDYRLLDMMFSEGLSAQLDENDLVGFIDKTGQYVIQPQFDYETSTYDSKFQEGMAVVHLNGQLGFINTKGEMVIELESHPNLLIDPYFKNSVAVVKMNIEGPIKRPFGSNESMFDYDLAVIDQDGKILIEPGQYETISDFDENQLAVAQKDGKAGLINTNNEIIFPFKYEYISLFYDDVALIKDNGSWGLINRNDDFIVEPHYQSFSRTNDDGLWVIQSNEQWGLINSIGEMLIEPQFQFSNPYELFNFSNGLARVESENQWGFINTQGEVVIPYTFDLVRDFIKIEF